LELVLGSLEPGEQILREEVVLFVVIDQKDV